MNEWARRALPALMISTGLLFTGATAAQAEEGSGNSGVGNGNRVEAPITVPIKVCGNAVGVLGEAEASCDTGPDTSAAAKSTVSPSMSDTVTPSLSPSAPKPGGSGAPEGALPLTGASVGWLLGASLLLLAGGGGMILLARRRVRRGAHAA